MRKVTKEVALDRFEKKHNNKYEYPFIDSEFKNSESLISIRCKVHGIFKQSVIKHYRGQGCKQCGFEASKLKRSTSFEEAVKEIESMYPGKFDFSETKDHYKSLGSKTVVRCIEHDVIFKPTLHNLKNGHGCYYCGIQTNKNREYSKKFTVSHFLDFDNFDYPDLKFDIHDYVKTTEKIDVVCKKHNHRFFIKLRDHLLWKSKGCSFCNNENISATLEKEDRLKKIKEKYQNFKIEKISKNNLKIDCHICGNTSFKNMQYLYTSLNKNLQTPCTFCNTNFRGKSQRNSFENFVEKVKSIKPDFKISKRSEWVGSGKSQLLIECSEGHFWEINNPNDLISKNRGCPICIRGQQSSSGEKELGDFIKSLGFEIITNSKRITKGLQEIDIYIPSLKIAFEYNGVYYHSDAFVDKNYHKNKTLDCYNEGVRLIHIWEDDWLYKNDIVKSFIKNTLNKNDQKQIYARNCIFTEITKEQSSSFLEKHHIQGFVNSSNYYGLLHNNEIVAVLNMTIRNDNSVILTRYASANVVGGFSKLLKNYLKQSSVKKIITFCDMAMFTGKLYEDFGFVIDKILDSDYQYTIKNKRYHKFNFRKNSIKNKFPDIYDPTKTEKQMMKEAGYNRIYDCGKIRYVFKV